MAAQSGTSRVPPGISIGLSRPGSSASAGAGRPARAARSPSPEASITTASESPNHRSVVDVLAVAADGNGRDGTPTDPGDFVNAGDLANPLFDGCVVSDSSWHGTFIAGQIGATSNNSLGVAGLSWSARVLPVRVSGKCGALVSDLLDRLGLEN